MRLQLNAYIEKKENQLLIFLYLDFWTQMGNINIGVYIYFMIKNLSV